MPTCLVLSHIATELMSLCRVIACMLTIVGAAKQCCHPSDSELIHFKLVCDVRVDAFDVRGRDDLSFLTSYHLHENHYHSTVVTATRDNALSPG